MSVNSSSFNGSALRPHLSSVSPYELFALSCFITSPSSFIYTSFFITNILLLLPLSIFILYLGFQQWRRQSSASTATTTMSHSDIFTYNLVAMDIIGVFGSIIFCCNVSRDHIGVSLVGLCLWSLIWYGEMFFHVLTCVEHYLAVVHPITYLSLRGERAIRARNISVGCVWLFSIGAACLLTFEKNFVFADFCVLFSSLVIISFCSLSTLCVLIRPGPGEQGGNRKKVDQSKLRAFYTMLAILGVLLLNFVWNLICTVLSMLEHSAECVMLASGTWLNLPSSLVLPVLYLHRAGILAVRTTTNNVEA